MKNFGQCHPCHSSTFLLAKPFFPPSNLVMSPYSHSVNCYITKWNEFQRCQQLIITVTAGRKRQAHTHTHQSTCTFTWTHTPQNQMTLIFSLSQNSLQLNFYWDNHPCPLHSLPLICFNVTYSGVTARPTTYIKMTVVSNKCVWLCCTEAEERKKRSRELNSTQNNVYRLHEIESEDKDVAS